MKKKKKDLRKSIKTPKLDKELAKVLRADDIRERVFCGYQPMQSARKK